MCLYVVEAQASSYGICKHVTFTSVALDIGA